MCSQRRCTLCEVMLCSTVSHTVAATQVNTPNMQPGDALLALCLKFGEAEITSILHEVFEESRSIPVVSDRLKMSVFFVVHHDEAVFRILPRQLGQLGGAAFRPARQRLAGRAIAGGAWTVRQINDHVSDLRNLEQGRGKTFYQELLGVSSFFDIKNHSGGT